MIPVTVRLSMHSVVRLAVIALFAFAHGTDLHAENLGQHGQTYALDQDARESIKDVIRQKQKMGEVDQFWINYRAKTIEAIKHPTPLDVPSSYSQRTELRDLKFTFSSDIRDERGVVLVKKGTAVEPLRLQPLQSGMVFIDGRDQRQVDYAIALGRKQPMKIVLTAGSPFELRVRYQNANWWGGTKTIPFYYDQRKMIINSMARIYGVHLGSVPVALTQDRDQLRVQYGLGGPQ